MNPLELALKYMEIFFPGKNLERLNDIFHRDLCFNGPFNNLNSAEDYIKSLKNDPPVGFSFELIKSYHDHNPACLIYEFEKPGVETTMTQLFEIKKNKIYKIRLIFNRHIF